ncbi:MAG: hypothetical protein U9P00_06155 [Pseudomonadota bacterium]|nr:hypothetical protein [Pseudomonadota bacterium]
MRNSDLFWPGISGIFLLLFGLGIWFSVQGQDTVQAIPLQADRRVMPILSSFTYNVYDGGELINVLEAEDLNVNPRRMLFFNVKNVNELTLTDARFDVYLREGTPAATDPFSVMESYLTVQEGDKDGRDWPKQFGLITRQVVKGLVQNIYQDQILVMVVKADTVYIDGGTDDTEYLNTSLTDTRSNRTILCKKAIWDKKENVFKIPGPYLLSESGQQKRGNAIKVGYDFIVETL